MARRTSGPARTASRARHALARLTARLARRAAAALDAGRAIAPVRRRAVVSLDDVRRRLELLVTAVYGRPIPITVVEPPKRRSWLAGRLPFGRGTLRAGDGVAATDGRRIQLPRRIESADRETALATYRLMAIEQAERMARGTPSLAPAAATPVERDLYLLRESVAVDAAIARTVPGLRSALTLARAVALAGRPALRALTPLERAVERLLRRVLSDDPTHGSTAVSVAGSAPAATPAESLAWARAMASEIGAAGGRYRGVAPVAAWGVVRPAPRADGHPPLPQADLTPTLRGGKYGVGRFGRGTGEGGRQASQEGQNQGVSDDPRRGEPNPSVDGSGAMTMSGAGRLTSDDSAGSNAPDAPEEDVRASADVAEGPPVAAAKQPDPARRHARWSRSRLPPPRPAGDGVEYPEWDWQAGDYRAAGAMVRPREPDVSDDTWGNQVLARYGPIVRQLRERFDRLRARRARLNQQRDGDELDLGACVRALVDQRTGHSANDRLYVAARPARRGLAITLLIDISGSTDEWIDGRRRVIDVEKVALLLASEALDALGDLYSVITFSGKGRANVRMRTIKDFGETNGALVRRRIAALEPEGYTRAGAAVRHATALLERQPAAHRLLLILSDGKPNDVDDYEGLSGVEDTRQAIIEARGRGVYPFCLTIDRQGQEYLGRIFGEAGHVVLRNAQQLPLALVKVVRHLLAS